MSWPDPPLRAATQADQLETPGNLNLIWLGQVYIPGIMIFISKLGIVYYHMQYIYCIFIAFSSSSYIAYWNKLHVVHIFFIFSLVFFILIFSHIMRIIHYNLHVATYNFACYLKLFCILGKLHHDIMHILHSTLHIFVCYAYSLFCILCILYIYIVYIGNFAYSVYFSCFAY